MHSLSALLISLAVAADPAPGNMAPGNTVLIDFSAVWCGPCRQMEPVVARLAAAGYPVRKVDIDHEKALASQFRIGSIPCFVLVVNGREVERLVGGRSQSELEGLLQRHGVASGSQVNQARSQSPDRANYQPSTAKAARTPENPNASEPLDQSLIQRLIAASVRLKIDDASGHSYGSGTIIDLHGDTALVLTCGHIFRDSKGQGRIAVDTFGPQAERGLAGRLIGYDLQSDVGLVSFRPSRSVSVARVAPTDYQVRRGDAVVNIGCNNGQDPTSRQSHVSGLDKFLGPANLQVAGQPVVGRSGGGLFNRSGQVIGVCNAADPADDEGLYAALASVRAELDRRGLSKVHRSGPQADGLAIASQQVAPGNVANAAPASVPPSMPQRMPAVAASEPLSRESMQNRLVPVSQRSAESGLNQLPGEERAWVAALASNKQAAEVICIVRSPGSGGVKSEVVVLDKVSPAFMQQLAAEQRLQQTQQTTLVQSRQAAAKPPAGERNAQPTTSRQQQLAGSRGPAWQPHWLQTQ